MKKVTDVLKTACREVHIKTEKSLVLKLKSINSVSDYADILTIFYGYFAPLENKIEEHITVDILPDILSRKRSSFIISDLHTLGYQVPIPIASELPAVNNYFQAAGVKYVLEGSTLGGQHIVQMLAAKPILHQRKDVMRFFGGYENDSMQMWEIFKDHIDTTIEEKDVGEVIPAAIDTFVLLEKWASNKDNDRELN